MARNQKPKRDSEVPTKAIPIPRAPKGNTAVNKERRQRTRANRQRNRSERLANFDSYTIPLDAMVLVESLPKKAQAEIPAGVESVPDPKRGIVVTRLSTTISSRGMTLGDIFQRRDEQAFKIAKKRKQRQNFRALTPKLRAEHREAGRTHKIPADLLGQ